MIIVILQHHHRILLHEFARENFIVINKQFISITTEIKNYLEMSKIKFCIALC